MLPTYQSLRDQLLAVLANKQEQGHIVIGLAETLANLPDSYDALATFARSLADLPKEVDWPFEEPNGLAAIWNACDPARPLGAFAAIDPDESARRVEAGFLASVCGCMLGKPVEVNPTLVELHDALTRTDAWPLDDYIPERTLLALGRRHRSWVESARERIDSVAPDDDINYTILGMMLLEQHGLGFTQADIRDLWLRHLPIAQTFGPERTLLLKAGINTLPGGDPDALDDWVNILNPNDEQCGAMIRADAYGYACPGRPALAAELAYRDASWTHRRTGIYATMFIAAAIAVAPVASDPLDIFAVALQFVPTRSRFHRIVADSLTMVHDATDWLDGYARIHGKYEEFSHCRVYQEVGTLINTLRFAESVGDGICKQVSQGNDADSYGATAGAILGAYFGPGYLDDRWLTPFDDTIRTSIATQPEWSLSRLAHRMGELPQRIAAELAAREESVGST
ncbi:MAG: ADP-ribosylglycohydrolase family protein [Thermomicrobia bacterium]|nr:ADP-ribosylglycohydrolase family protein [Thermomicrobia bacterium]